MFDICTFFPACQCFQVQKFCLVQLQSFTQGVNYPFGKRADPSLLDFGIPFRTYSRIAATSSRLSPGVRRLSGPAEGGRSGLTLARRERKN